MKAANILITEPVALEQVVLKNLLIKFGYQSELASSADEAMHKVESTNFDLVLMSLQMPVNTVLHATDYIRKVLRSDVPIVATCAFITPEVIHKCEKVGINDVISKPVVPGILRCKINKLLYPMVISPSPWSAKVLLHLPTKRLTDLSAILQRTKANPQLMKHLIALYLKHSPVHISDMQMALSTEDWKLLHAAAHKMIPSFSILGLHKSFELMAREIQDYQGDAASRYKIANKVAVLEMLFAGIYQELENELRLLHSNPV